MPVRRIEFSKSFEGLLEDTAQSQVTAPGVSEQSEIIRRAVALYVFLHKAVDGKGLRVAIIDEDEKIQSIIGSLP